MTLTEFDDIDDILANAAPNRPENAIPATHPLGIRLPESNPQSFRLVSLADIGPSEEPVWIMPGFIARGHITLLTGLWKGGKSTLVAHLLRDIHKGGGLAGPDPLDADIVVLSEEPTSVWARRRDELDLSGRVLLIERDTFARLDLVGWRRTLADIARIVQERGVALVVIDTLPGVWPVTNENDASEVLTALAPIRDISSAGAAVLLCFHPRKGDGTQGTATRGSGAIPGFVDVILELRRHNPEDASDRRRSLTAYGRFDSIPPETIIELGDDGYRVVGDRAEVRQLDRDDIIRATLPADGPGLTADDLREAWSGAERPAIRTLRGILNHGAATGKGWTRSGMGHKGDPFRYRLAAKCHSGNLDPRGDLAGIESAPGGDDLHKLHEGAASSR